MRMKISEKAKSWIMGNLRYNPEAGSLTSATDGSDVVVIRRNRMKVLYYFENEIFWLDAPSVCWLLWKQEWPEYGVVIDNPKQASNSILRSWNLKKRTRADFVKNEQVITTKEVIEVALACAFERYADVIRFGGNGEDTEPMVFNVDETIRELGVLLNRRSEHGS
jgi:hypothetical protein